MNLDYIIKRCHGFGYATDFKQIKLKDIGLKSKIILMTDSSSRIKINGADKITDLDKYLEDLDKNKPTEPATFLVEVGHMTKVMEKVDHCLTIDQITDAVYGYDDPDVDPEMKTLFKEQAIKLYNESKTAVKTEFTSAFLNYLEHLYPHIDDSVFQRTILKTLVFNSRDSSHLQHDHPIRFDEEEVEKTVFSDMFRDIEVNDPYFDKSLRETEETALKGVMRSLDIKTLSQFNGFGRRFGQIENIKRGANLDEISVFRDHAVIHMLARNRIVATPVPPRGQSEFSFDKLMRVFEHFDKFAVVFVYPQFQGSFVFAETPKNMLQVDTSNGNVILAVLFRYMCINFFGMHSIIDAEDMAMKYYI